jgi:hypothetical protein
LINDAAVIAVASSDNMHSLCTLRIENCKISHVALNFLCTSTKLPVTFQYFANILASTQLDDDILFSITRSIYFIQITQLTLESLLSDSALDFFFRHATHAINLRSLTIINNYKITDEIIKHLAYRGRFPALVELRFHGCPELTSSSFKYLIDD